MTATMSGGCQCGRVRYVARIDSDDAYLCHCRMCQRATGGVSIAFRNVAYADVSWTGEPLDYYQSSPIARRGYCAACGTPLTFEFTSPSETLDVTVGSFDDPARFRPTLNYGVEGLHEAWLDTRSLPRSRSDENANVTERWIEACGKAP